MATQRSNKTAASSSKAVFPKRETLAAKKRANKVTTRINHDALFESVNGIIWSADAKTLQFKYVSPYAKKLLGYSTKEWLATDQFWEKHIHEEDRAHTIRFCATATRKKEDHTLEYRMITKNGKVVWLRDVVKVVCRNGKPHELHGLMVDVTRERQSQARAQKAELINKLIFENSGEGILLTDDQGHVFSANPEACRLLNLSEKEIVKKGRNGIVNTQDKRLEQLFDAGKQGQYSGRLQLKRYGKGFFEAEVSLKNFQANDGTVKTVVLFKDISERLHYTEQLNIIRKKAVDSEEKLRKFFDSTSDSIIFADKDYTIYDFNAAASRYVRSLYHLDLKIGQSLLAFTSEATRTTFKENFGMALSGNEVTKEMELPHSVGKRIWWRIKYSPIYNYQKQVVGVAFIATDIDFERRTNDRLLSLMSNIPEAVFYEYWVTADDTNHGFSYLCQRSSVKNQLPSRLLSVIYVRDRPPKQTRKDGHGCQSNYCPFYFPLAQAVAHALVNAVERFLADGCWPRAPRVHPQLARLPKLLAMGFRRGHPVTEIIQFLRARLPVQYLYHVYFVHGICCLPISLLVSITLCSRSYLFSKFPFCPVPKAFVGAGHAALHGLHGYPEAGGYFSG